jgi:hypothetical protein
LWRREKEVAVAAALHFSSMCRPWLVMLALDSPRERFSRLTQIELLIYEQFKGLPCIDSLRATCSQAALALVDA